MGAPEQRERFKRGSSSAQIRGRLANDTRRKPYDNIRPQHTCLRIEGAIGFHEPIPQLARGLRPFRRGDVHQPNRINQLFERNNGRHGAQELHILHRLVAPQVSRGFRDIADGGKMRAGGFCSFQSNRISGDRLQVNGFVGAIFARSHRAAFMSDQTARNGHNAHHSRPYFWNLTLIGKHHRRIAEAAR